MNRTNGRIDALIRREAALRDAKAALRAEKAKQKQLAHRTAAEIHKLVGAAVAADLERPMDENRALRAYIKEMLDRAYAKKSSARTLLEAKGWL